MKDPLTRREKNNFLQTFRKAWEQSYAQALASGALLDKEPHDHTVARYCLILTAEYFRPIHPENRKELANLQHFV